MEQQQSQYTEEQLKAAIDKLLDQFANQTDTKHDDHGDEILDGRPRKLIDCPHEIVFTVNANVLAQNEKGEHISTEEICVKNYHIPVPIDQDYHVFMSGFFQHIERSIESSYSQTTEIKDTKNE